MGLERALAIGNDLVFCRACGDSACGWTRRPDGGWLNSSRAPKRTYGPYAVLIVARHGDDNPD
jgi:hypothetical protein